MPLPLQDQVLCGDALTHLRELPSSIAQTCCTSPPYFNLRAYLPQGHPDKDKEIGLEAMPEQYVAKLVEVFREVKRVLKDDGTLWLVIGDSFWNQSPIRASASEAWETKYTGGKISDGNGRRRSTKGHPTLKEKDLMMIPSRLALALQDDGWWVRSDISWVKEHPMPEPVTDRPKRSHERVFLLTKSERYFYSPETPLQDVWTIATSRHNGDHKATFPPELASTCIKAGSKPGDLVLDCFAGSGTTLEVAADLGRHYLGIELFEGFRSDIESRTRGALARAQEREVFESMMAADDVAEEAATAPSKSEQQPTFEALCDYAMESGT